MSRILPGGRWAAPVLSGLLLTLSFPPFELLLPPFVALVPFLLYVAEQGPGHEGRRAAVRGGFVLGAVHFGTLLYWLIVALIFYSKLAIPAYILTVAILAGFTAGFAGALHFLRDRVPAIPFALAAAMLWTTLEWVQGHLSDLSFPWLGLGNALAGFPRVAGAADLVGTRGLTFWLALVNGLVATAVLAIRAGRPVLKTAAIATAVITAPVAYGFWRAATLELRPVAEIAVVQPNIPEDLKMQRAAAIDSSLTAVTNLMERIPPGTVDLVVWPEVTLPAILEHPYERFLVEEIRALSSRVAAPVVAGAYGMGDVVGEDLTLYNSAFLVTDEGIIGDAYHKKYLVPFVERIPFIDPALLKKLVGNVQYFGGIGRGVGAVPKHLLDSQFGVLICYESIFADHAREFRRQGTEFLVNMTNDAWYGREPWYTRTSALWQHPAHLVMRSIETRTGTARAANTGISMFIDPLGRTYEKTRLFEPDVRVATVYTTDVVTLFVRWGDWLATAVTIGSVLLLLYAKLAPGRAVAAPVARPRSRASS